MTQHTIRQAILGPCVFLADSSFRNLVNDNPHRQAVHKALIHARDIIHRTCEWEETHNPDRSMLTAQQVDIAHHRLRYSLDPEYQAECDELDPPPTA